MKFARDSIFNLGTLITVAILSFILNIFIARVSGPEGKGLYSLIVQVNGLFALGISFGLGNSAIFLLGRKLFPESVVAGNLFSLSFILGSVATVLALTILFAYGELEIFGIPSTLLVIILLLTPISLARIYSAHLLAAFNDFRRYNGVSLIDIGSRCIFLVVFLTMGAGVAGMTWAIVFSTVIAAFMGWRWVHNIALSFSFRLNKAFFSQAISFGIRTYIVTWLFASALRIDFFVISSILDVSSVGIYSVAVSFAELSRYIAIAVSLVLFKRVSSTEDNNSSVRISGQVTRIITFLSVLLAFVLGLTAFALIPILFGQEFVGAIPAVWWLLLGIPMFNLTQVMQNDLAGRGKPEFGIVAVLASLLVMVGLDILLVPIWGIVGAAIASSIAYTVGAIIMFVFYSRETGQWLIDVVVISKQDLKALVSLVRQLTA